MDVHPSRELVASGQRAGVDRKSQAHVRIWSTESLQTLYVFGMGELNVGITAVAFSQLVSFASLCRISIALKIGNFNSHRMEAATSSRPMQVRTVFWRCINGNGATYLGKLR